MSDLGTSAKIELSQMFKGHNRQLAGELIGLVEEFKSYWPMTVRAFYYQAVSRLLIQNKHSEYRRVSRILTDLRRAELVSWLAVEDRTRHTSGKRGLQSVSDFIASEFSYFLNPSSYARCLIQEQQVYCEISVEKDALSNHVEGAAWRYCTRVNTCKGMPSATMLNDMAERFDKAAMLGKMPILLHFGDLDPSGVQIPKAMQAAFDLHGVEVDVRNVALTPAQCLQYNLPQSPDAAKAKDPNYARWVKAYGDQSPTELDAMHPEDLKSLVKQSLADVYDTGEMGEQEKREEEERDLLQEMRLETIVFLADKFPDYADVFQL